MGVFPSLESAAWAGVRGDRRGKGPRHLGQARGHSTWKSEQTGAGWEPGVLLPAI